VLSTLQSDGTNKVLLQRSEFVGAQVGEELREAGWLRYVARLGCRHDLRCGAISVKFSLASCSGACSRCHYHFGFFSIFEVEFDLTVLAALLPSVGYSLNDTIVVCDRIRENFRIMRDTEPYDLVNEID